MAGAGATAGEDATAEEVAAGAALRAELMRGLPSRRGMLKKLGGFCLGIDALKSVVDRWCELRGPVLEYYSTIAEAAAPSRRPKGTYVLTPDATLTAPARHEKLSAISPFCFMVVDGAGTTEIFAAASESEYRDWVTTIEGVLTTLRRR